MAAKDFARDMKEVFGLDHLQTKIDNGQRIRAFWGTSTTGIPHLAYLIPMLKIAHLVKLDCTVIILLADCHAVLENKCDSTEMTTKAEMYETILVAILKALKVPLDKIEFRRGSEFQTQRMYSFDLIMLMSRVNLNAAKKAGSEVVKQDENPKIGMIVYPLLQVLDEKHLDVDIQLGGVDQRKIFVLGKKLFKWQKTHLMTPMLGGLNGNKMSSSDIDSKIEFTDSLETITKKINKVWCQPGNEDTILFDIVKHIIDPCLQTSSLVDLKESFIAQMIRPDELKRFVSNSLNSVIEPIRNALRTN